MADERPDRYVDDGVTVYRASALGSCPKVLVALGLGMTPEPFPAWLLAKFKEGIDGEPVVLAKLAERGWCLYGHQQQVELWIGSRLVVRGHLDALGDRGKGERVVEVKCVSGGYRDEIVRALPPLYHWQCATYGRALGVPVVLALGVKDDSGAVVRVEERDVDVAGAVAVKLRVMQLEEHIAAGTWPACSYRQFPCPFPELCDDPVPAATEDWELARVLEESLRVRH